ncbi:winged helix-turn-helix transcriptional regulator [Cohnella rhizosphaerae]|uniref:Helix-turn-helix transcriptional regulator n=1 Tax=Cohnella rhizosphaerae TaxID=1457232 RepID=A0A9X4KVH9_9BACL|nr:helix-turn-helix domain-containing protein [Cohnella rhizosphaerae]MDG0811178.1 helix-turn-helix transcriptional regulator [Cohnella rhizosphaerae]
MASTEQCHAAEAVDIFAGKWNGDILFHLFTGGTKRFNELRALVPGITQKILTGLLRELEEQDIVKRVVYPQVPPKVEYSVTDYGRTLEPVIVAMHLWGERHKEHMRQKKVEEASSVHGAHEAGGRS